MTSICGIPATELKRLQARERANRRRARDMGKPFEAVSIEGLLLLQDGKCAKTGKPLIFDPRDPDREAGKPIIAHEDCLAMKRSPGHVVGNVWLWRNDANQEEARAERSALALGQRVRGETRKPKGKIGGRQLQSRGFQKPPEGHSWWKRKVK